MERLTSLSDLEQSFILDGVLCGVRADGRNNTQFRPLQIDRQTPLPATNGSARVTIGNTEVLVGVKVEVVDTPPDIHHILHGAINARAECSSAVLSQFGVSSKGQRRDLNAEISAALQRLYNANTLDLKALCIIPNKAYWTVFIDCVVLALDGSLLDALSFAIRAALASAQVPKTRILSAGKVVQSDDINAQQDDLDFEVSPYAEDFSMLPFQDVPIWISQVKVGSKFIVDSTLEEEICMNAKVSVGVNGKGQICGVLQTGSGGIAPNSLLSLIKNARHMAPELLRQIDHTELTA